MLTSLADDETSPSLSLLSLSSSLILHCLLVLLRLSPFRSLLSCRLSRTSSASPFALLLPFSLRVFFFIIPPALPASSLTASAARLSSFHAIHARRPSGGRRFSTSRMTSARIRAAEECPLIGHRMYLSMANELMTLAREYRLIGPVESTTRLRARKINNAPTVFDY